MQAKTTPTSPIGHLVGGGEDEDCPDRAKPQAQEGQDDALKTPTKNQVSVTPTGNTTGPTSTQVNDLNQPKPVGTRPPTTQNTATLNGLPGDIPTPPPASLAGPPRAAERPQTLTTVLEEDTNASTPVLANGTTNQEMRIW